MVLFVGQIDRGSRERDTFQEVDYRQMFGGMAKWVAEIEDAARIPEFVHRAFATAMAGRPGPVVLALPEDMLVETADGRRTAARPRPSRPHPPPEAMAELRRLLAARRAAVRDPGRRRLERGRGRGAGPLPRRQRPAGGLRLPPPGPARQRPSLLRRPYRPRPQPQARRADQGRRPRPRHRRPAGRDHQPELHPPGRAAARGRPSSTSTTTPRSWAGSTRPTSRSPPA